MEREECEGARSGALRSPKQDNRKSKQEPENKMKALLEMRETKRKHKDKRK